jgi:hypothetical protein
MEEADPGASVFPTLIKLGDTQTGNAEPGVWLGDWV